MKLHEFIQQFGSLSDEAFLAVFTTPILVQEGGLKAEGGGEPQMWHLRVAEEGPGSLVLGRKAGVDVRVRHSEISSRHAKLHPSGGDAPWQIEDLNSTNGTFVEGKRLAAGVRHPLQDGALVRFGPNARLVFYHPDSFLEVVRKLSKGESVPIPREQTDLGSTITTQNPLNDVTGQFSVSDVLNPEPEPEEPATAGGVVIRCDPFDPVPLSDGQAVVIGRSPGSADLVLPHGHISRQHAEIRRTGETVTIRDMNSANGTFLCGMRLGSRALPLLPGKPVTLGPFKIWLEGGAEDVDLGQTMESLRTPDLQGRLESFSLTDLLQEMEDQRKTGVIELKSSAFGGRVAVRSGDPYNAATSDGDKDEDALRKLLQLKTGNFVLMSDESLVGERTMTLSVGEILLDEFLRTGE